MILAPGQATFTLIAPNAWGKTSRAKALLTGALDFDAHLPAELMFWLRCLRPNTIAMISQGADRRFSARTALDYLSMSMVLSGRSAFEAQRNAQAVLTRLNLHVTETQPIWTLSGGEEQIIYLVGQLLQVHPNLRERHLLVCDDPFMMLDDIRIAHFQFAMSGGYEEFKPAHFMLCFPRRLPALDLVAPHIHISCAQRPALNISALDLPGLQDAIDPIDSLTWTCSTIHLERTRKITIPAGSWKQRELNLIVGRNGTGKSLFCSLLSRDGGSPRKTLTLHSFPYLQGHVVANGQDVLNSRSTSQLRVGIVPQQIHRISNTLDDYATRLHKGKPAWQSLLAVLDQWIGAERSFGLQKLFCTCKCALSLYLAGSNVIVFDEPDMALDDSSIAVVRQVVQFLICKRVLVVVITHSPEAYGSESNITGFGDYHDGATPKV